MSVSGTCTGNNAQPIFVYNTSYNVSGVDVLEMDFYGKNDNNGYSYPNTNGGSFYIKLNANDTIQLLAYSTHANSYVNMTTIFTLITTI
jgi:hypothetical protein